MIKPGKIAKQLNQLTFSLLLSGYKRCKPDWYKPFREQPHFSLWFITKGSGEVTVDGTKHKLKPGKLVIFTPGMICEKKTSQSNPLEFYFVRFTYAVAFEDKEKWYFETPENTTFPLRGVFSITNTGNMIHLLDQIHHLSKRRGPTVAIQRKLHFQELLLMILQDFRSQKIAGDSTMAIETTIEYMVNNYHNHMTLSDLAQMAGLSTSHYARLFKKYVGYSPIDYLTHVRIDRAKELLAISDFRIKEISQSVGYEDELYFSRIFKRIVGVSPTQFSDNHKTLGNTVKR
ncbi:helix-turn-helix domain-containing protein [Ferdinandcohnia sp. Marseille-Q9671]